MHYINLSYSLINSSVWLQPNHIRIVWITMLLTADKDGILCYNDVVIARWAGVTIEECRDAIKWLESPDPYNNEAGAKENEGRRIKQVLDEGEHWGWDIHNFEAYGYTKTSRKTSKK